MSSFEGREHQGWRDAAERLFTAGLPQEEAEALYAHLRGCGSCERAFEELARAERALFPSGQGDGFTPAARDRVKERLFAGSPAVVAPARSTRAWWSLGAAAAAALVVIFAVRVPESEFRSRGAAVKLSGQIGVRALRVFEDSTGKIGVEDSAAVAVGDRLKILYTNLGERYRFVAAAVIGEGGRELARVGPVESPRDAQDAGLGAAIPVEAATWPVGQVTIVAVFSRDRLEDLDFGSLSPRDGEEEAVRVTKLWVRP